MTTKERIIQEASKLFVQRGIRNVTMNDLADHLGISKRTIYENINDKNELLIECLDYYECIIEEKVRRFESEKIIDVLIESINTGISSVEQTIGNFFLEIKKYHPSIFSNNIEKYRQKRLERTSRFLEKGIKEGFFKADLNVEVVAVIFSNMFKIIDKLDEPGFSSYQMPELFRSVFITFFRGISTAEGIKQIDNTLK